MTQFPPWLELAKAFAAPFATVVASIVVASVTACFAWRQWIVAKEKLRHDLYVRRFAIYMAFHKLLVAVVEKQDVEAELREANAARAQSPFLLDEQLGAYLEKLHTEAVRIKETGKLCLDASNFSSPAERTTKAAQLGHDKLSFLDAIGNLAEEFSRLLRLKDFAH